MRPRSFRTTFSHASGIVARPFRMKGIERETCGFDGVVVAADTVPIEGRLLRRNGGTRRAWAIVLVEPPGLRGPVRYRSIASPET